MGPLTQSGQHLPLHRRQHAAHQQRPQQQPGRQQHKHHQVGDRHQQVHQQLGAGGDLLLDRLGPQGGMADQVTHPVAAGTGKAEPQNLAMQCRGDTGPATGRKQAHRHSVAIAHQALQSLQQDCQGHEHQKQQR